MKDYLVKFAKPFKSCGIAGRVRFWILYWAYKITGWHIRQDEWDFILPYLPKLIKEKQRVRVLDVGCARNLLAYEIVHRGYDLVGIDLEDFQEDYPAYFLKYDIREYNTTSGFDFVTCISVLEHIENGQDRALSNMINSLKIGGRLLLTIPTHEFAQGHDWHGFNIKEVEEMLTPKGRILEYTEKAGQLCLCIGRIN